MDIAKYYKILGLDEDASEQEIRKRYRFLAKKLHPDHNTSHNAKEQFILVNEAYEGIFEFRKNEKEYRSTKRKEKSKEERLKEARKRYYEQIRKEELENERYFNSLTSGFRWKLMKIFAVLGFVLAFANLVDYLLPYRYEADTISAYSLPFRESRQQPTVWTKKGNVFHMQHIDYTLYTMYPEIYVERTRLFHEAVNIISIQKTEHRSFEVGFGLYYFKYLFILVFLFPLFTFLYKRKTVVFTLFFHLSLYLAGPVMLLFLALGNHLVHLLTLGFA